ncbi:exonuclease domain-containing protein [Hirsutella rhossiliensis]|uniref:RNA exonuclease 4 n=1 Tax=Hirsutella rhossiliensis TaxID=111463 RepID=A0A9P8SEY4_9HYPO|nr:exonuclease domain-containing protein [Hirsutella rhossiliensis]KAH0960303.1 exonuclease domain-containing protein [Hirsutella rhossiliensis]
MAELSSNWKLLQAKLKAQGTSDGPSKRKAINLPTLPAKRPKVGEKTTKQPVPRQKQDGSGHRVRKMGGVQSSAVRHESKNDLSSPSLALWAEDNDISAEDLAEAYGLGLESNTMALASQNDKVNHGFSTGIDIGKYVAIDCEMVGVGPGAHESALARVSLVDFHGRQIYDSFVKPRERVTDWRTAVSGVSQKEMRFARDFEEVQKQVFDITKDRVLVGHDIKHDLEALMLSHSPRDIRDTAKHASFRKFGNGRKPALKILARQLLGVEVQDGSHSSIEDARATMLLFRKHKSEFDVDHANRYTPKAIATSRHTGKKPRKKKDKNP